MRFHGVSEFSCLFYFGVVRRFLCGCGPIYVNQNKVTISNVLIGGRSTLEIWPNRIHDDVDVVAIGIQLKGLDLERLVASIN